MGESGVENQIVLVWTLQQACWWVFWMLIIAFGSTSLAEWVHTVLRNRKRRKRIFNRGVIPNL